MNPPSIAAYRLLCAILLGIALGVFYGFLRPLGRRHRQITDLLFILALYPVWIFFAFGIAGGDLRFGYTLGLFGGVVLWETTFGKWLQPVFAGFGVQFTEFTGFSPCLFEKFSKNLQKSQNFSLQPEKSGL